jgi:hypothetical protein
MSRRYTRDELAAQLNSTFQLHFSPEIVKDAVLAEVSELKGMGPYESFVITFLIPDECPVQQRIYQLVHPEIGEMELFLVPSGKDEKGTTYASVLSYKKD